MILTCPECGTQYVVKDGAIPPEGRQVRCAACKHSWHQDPEAAAAQDAPEEAETEAATVSEAPAIADEPAPVDTADAVEDRSDEDESLAEATLIDPRSGPEAEERAFEEAAIVAEPEAVVADPQPAAAAPDWQEPPVAEAQDDEFSPFPASDGAEPARRSPVMPILVVVLVVIALAAAFWFLAPDSLKASLGLGGAGSTPLALVTTHMDRQRLESGNELLTVTGRVINPTGKEQDVPPLQAQLKTRAGKVVYSWTIAPPARSLPAGASASFNSAEVNVPPVGDELTITLGQPSA